MNNPAAEATEPLTSNHYRIHYNNKTVVRNVLLAIAIAATAILIVRMIFNNRLASDPQNDLKSAVGQNANTSDSIKQESDNVLKIKLGESSSVFDHKVHIQLNEIQFDEASSKYKVFAVITFPGDKKVKINRAEEGSIFNYNKEPYEIRVAAIEKNTALFVVKKTDLQKRE